MKGFEIPKRTMLLTFKGTDYDGAEVKVSLDASVDLLLQIRGMEDDQILIYAKFGEALLLEWNLEKDGKPIPVGAKGMTLIPATLANIIINQWTQEVSAVPVPLAELSGNGSGSEEDETPGVEQSLNLGNSSRRRS